MLKVSPEVVADGDSSGDWPKFLAIPLKTETTRRSAITVKAILKQPDFFRGLSSFFSEVNRALAFTEAAGFDELGLFGLESGLTLPPQSEQ